MRKLVNEELGAEILLPDIITVGHWHTWWAIYTRDHDPKNMGSKLVAATRAGMALVKSFNLTVDETVTDFTGRPDDLPYTVAEWFVQAMDGYLDDNVNPKKEQPQT